MIFLDSSTKLQVVLGGAVAFAESKLAISYIDFGASTQTPGLVTSTTSGATPVDVLAAPAASTVRGVTSIQMLNADTASITVTIRTNNGGTLTTVVKVTLSAGDHLFFEDKGGWKVVTQYGYFRTGFGSSGSLIRAPQYLTSGTSYSPPSGCTAIDVELVSAGGGGGGCSSSASNAAAAGGGGAGGYLQVFVVNPSASITYAIGAGGTAGANTGGTGGTGGTTSITINGTTYSSTGGVGGAGMTTGNTISTVLGGISATPTSATVNARCQPGEPGTRLSGTVACSGNGGSGPFGGGGIGSNADNTAGANATGYGAGGAGANTLGGGAVIGGTGSQGLIVIHEYY